MRDCILKTNNFDELVPFINEHYANALMDSIHYYDTVKDECKHAKMELYENEDNFYKQKFVEWRD
jgi:hypothetical protein